MRHSRHFKDWSPISGHTLCPGCPGGILWRYILNAFGKRSIIQLSACCISRPAIRYPTLIRVPSIYISMPPVAAGASGIRAAIRVLTRSESRKGEDRKRINVIAISGDGGASDIGFASLSGAAERNEDIIFICFDNEAYMNTGNQRSGLTPYGAWTHSTLEGKIERKKDLPSILAAHNIPYVATAAIGFPDDIEEKFQRAKGMGAGFKYIHVLCPCSVGWGFPTEKTAHLSRLAVETGAWPLYEVVQGRYRITHRLSPRRPIKEYLSTQKRFSHFTPDDFERMDNMVVERIDELRRRANLQEAVTSGSKKEKR